MYRFETTKKILQDLAGGHQSHAHATFWSDSFSRDEFVSHTIRFGLDSYPLVTLGDGANSNIVKAMLGIAPFGLDLHPPTPGAIFRHMPPNSSEILKDATDYIRHWIDDGCPTDPIVNVPVDTTSHSSLSDDHHNSYWRDFDVWSLFHRPRNYVDAILTCYQGIGGAWMQYVERPDITREVWSNYVKSPNNSPHIRDCTVPIIDTVAQFYGNPIQQEDLFDAFAKFGEMSLPPDSLRPLSPRRQPQGYGQHQHSPEYHTMNGENEWFLWFGVGMAAIESGFEVDAWLALSKAVMIGIIHDGIFRRRFSISNYDPASADTPQRVRDDIRDLTAAECFSMGERLLNESGLIQRTQRLNFMDARFFS